MKSRDPALEVACNFIYIGPLTRVNLDYQDSPIEKIREYSRCPTYIGEKWRKIGGSDVKMGNSSIGVVQT